jgi:O-acetyl-ADP-ribose deacetylase (regulator of RNase III)
MIELTSGNVLESNTEALVNTVNCVGVMGRGIAAQFKQKFPANFQAYSKACKAHQVRPGKMFIFKTGDLLGPAYIVNFPTKDHWKGHSKMQFIDDGLDDLVAQVEQLGIKSISIPPLGCGLGGLRWADVKPRIEQALKQVPSVKAYLFEPDAAMDQSRATEPPKALTNSRAALICLVRRYLPGLFSPDFTLLELHKLLYFLQEAGESLKLRYQPLHYGPYAENLRHVLKEMEGTWIFGFGTGGEDPAKVLEIRPDAFEAAEKILADQKETLGRCDRVISLVRGFEGSFGLELLATVHWVCAKQGATNAEDALRHVQQWSPRKREIFNARQVSVARESLVAAGWLQAI